MTLDRYLFKAAEYFAKAEAEPDFETRAYLRLADQIKASEHSAPKSIQHDPLAGQLNDD